MPNIINSTWIYGRVHICITWCACTLHHVLNLRFDIFSVPIQSSTASCLSHVWLIRLIFTCMLEKIALANDEKSSQTRDTLVPIVIFYKKPLIVWKRHMPKYFEEWCFTTIWPLLLISQKPNMITSCAWRYQIDSSTVDQYFKFSRSTGLTCCALMPRPLAASCVFGRTKISVQLLDWLLVLKIIMTMHVKWKDEPSSLK